MLCLQILLTTDNLISMFIDVFLFRHSDIMVDHTLTPSHTKDYGATSLCNATLNICVIVLVC